MMIQSSKTYRSASADVVVEHYETLFNGWLWRVLYRYAWQNKYTIYENGLRERPSEERIAQICKNVG